MPKSDKILVTAALPYANGPIHIGSLLEYIQTDIYVKFLKSLGKDALYICASDMHGTPIEVNAKKVNLSPEIFAEKFWREHQEDLKNFFITFDNFYKTHSPENKELSILFFNELRKKDLIYTKEIEQMFDEEAQQFLPDRFVKGSCPKCQAEDQYGDICEKCNSPYTPTELIKPTSTLTNSTPILKKSTHYFFKLGNFSKDLEQWIATSNIQKTVKNFVSKWIKEGLQDWCISRDAPYFGFEIPGSKEETGAVKYFYVWLDAPIGYISSTKNFTDTWREYWYDGQVHHIIGKDIIYFHYLFWPAMLLGVGIPLPELTTHGFITVNGQKMSKSRGTFFTAKDFLKLYPAEALRFYYASHLDRKVVDIDLNFDDFIAVNNNVLMGNLGNFCYRTLTFAAKNYEKIDAVAAEDLTTKVVALQQKVKENYEQLNFKAAVKYILQIADIGNAYFQEAAPWKDKEASEAKVGWCVNLARDLAIMVAPILPEFSQKVFASLGGKPVAWSGLEEVWKGKVTQPEKLVQKIEKAAEDKSKFPLDFRVGHITKVEDHPNADKLFIFEVDFGSEKKKCVTSLKEHLPREAFLGKKIVFCMNLKPAKFRGELSEVMIIAAEEGDNIVPLEMAKSELGAPVVPEGMKVTVKQVDFAQFSKVKMNVKGKKVCFDGKVLKTAQEEVLVEVSDKAVVR